MKTQITAGVGGVGVEIEEPFRRESGTNAEAKVTIGIRSCVGIESRKRDAFEITMERIILFPSGRSRTEYGSMVLEGDALAAFKAEINKTP